ncbi:MULTISPECIES: glycosyltransferase family 4 protein [unclassified Rudaea]|uniref:glycosyltransferase family 4 protein n=1 Tax=unclassified Rudaea TaxID=2627037 RepID=UPI0020168851|nr:MULTISPECIES: glycosyltransferase family 4 protein [unclassified Rudaea]
MSDTAALFLVLACAAFSAFATWLSIRYAHRRRLLDMPGQRRSHSVPTPRGGGIGIVAAVLAALAILAANGQMRILGESAIAAVAIVAAVGWIDDHRGLSARVRLAAHLVAVVVLYFYLFRFLVFLSTAQPFGGSVHAARTLTAADYAIPSVLVIVFVLANVWFVNLHNFMDGINGLLASQAIFIFLALAWLVQGDNRLVLLLGAAAVVGFLPFNFPRARVFMGDVGSGALGLLIAGAVVLQALSFHGSPFSGLIVCSAFVADATCTLLSRMLRGRRWYSAHREHLYQWLVRSGFSHARVVAFYMGWNLCVVVPVLYAVNRGAAPTSPSTGFAWTLAVYLLAAIVWIAGKRWCLKQASHAKKQEI